MRNSIREVRKTVSHSPSLVATALGVSRQTIYRMLEDGRLKGTTLKDVVEYVRRAPGKRLDNSQPTAKQSPRGNPHPLRNVK